MIFPSTITWHPIDELVDLYEQRILLASPKLIDGDANPEGISTGFWQDDEGWIVNGWDMCKDQPTKITLDRKDVTHFAYALGPFSSEEKE
jgi:hypothetical protein